MRKCAQCGKWMFFNDYDRCKKCRVAERAKSEEHDDFTSGMVVGAMTDSPVLGAMAGGGGPMAFMGGMVGAGMNSTPTEEPTPAQDRYDTPTYVSPPQVAEDDSYHAPSYDSPSYDPPQTVENDTYSAPSYDSAPSFDSGGGSCD